MIPSCPRFYAMLVLISVQCLSAEAKEAPNIQLNEVSVALPSREVALSLVVFTTKDFTVRVIDNSSEKDASKYPDLATAMTENGCVAGCNGGFFSRKPFAPVGGMISNGITVSRVNRHTWMKGLLVVRQGQPALELVDAFDSNTGITELLQSGTWLVREGKSETDNSRDKIARRTFIGHDAYGRWFLGASSPCTLHELAAALRAPEVHAVIDVQSALNLDGGPSTGLWLKQSPEDYYLQELWPDRNYVGIVPRSK